MEERTLEQKVDKLTQMVRLMGEMVKDIYLHQNGINSTETQSKTTQTQSYSSGSDNELIAKNTINWDELLLGSEGTKSEKFVRSIYNNTYPTVTQGQFNVLQSIAEQLSISLYS